MEFSQIFVQLVLVFVAFQGGSDWKSVQSEEGKFRAIFPGETKKMVRSVPTPIGKLKLTMTFVDSRAKKEFYGVVYSDYPPNPQYGTEKFDYKVLNGVVSGNARGLKAKILEQKKIKIGKYNGIEGILKQNKNRQIVVRAYLVKNRLYQVQAVWASNKMERPERVKKFLKSFQIEK